jgi:membrane protein
MARNSSRWRKVLGETISSWDRHDAFTQSAALAFYTLFSLAPVLLVVVSLSGAVFGREKVRGEIVGQFQDLMGKEAGVAVEGLLEKAQSSIHGGLAGILGLATLLFGTTAVFMQLQTALNVVWEVRPKQGHVIKTLLIKRLLSFAVVLAVGFLLLVSLALSAGLAAFGTFAQSWLSAPMGVLEAINAVSSFLVFSVLFAMIYRILPDVDIAWRDVVFGAVVTSALFSVGKWLIGLYIGHSSIVSGYGAAGSIIVIVLWVYYTSLIALFGAEFTRVHSRHFFGSKRAASEGARRVHTVEVPGTAKKSAPTA